MIVYSTCFWKMPPQWHPVKLDEKLKFNCTVLQDGDKKIIVFGFSQTIIRLKPGR